MSFKKGDGVLVRDLSLTSYWHIRQVDNVMKNGNTVYTTETIEDEMDFFYVDEDEVRALPKASKLNKKLYPSYVEWNGYLVPPELRDEISKN